MVNSNKTVGVSIKSETYIQFFLKNFLLQKFRIYCTALRIDIEPIWRRMPDVHCGAKLPKQCWSYGRCCTMRTVETDTKIYRRLTLQGLSEKIDILLYTTLIKERMSNSFSCQRLRCLRATYPSFNCLLKRIF